MSTEITGTIIRILNKETFASGFEKQDIIVETEDQYPQPISIQFLKDKINLLNGFNEGDRVKVSYNLRGKEHTPAGGETKWYNSVVGWKIERQ